MLKKKKEKLKEKRLLEESKIQPDIFNTDFFISPLDNKQDEFNTNFFSSPLDDKNNFSTPNFKHSIENNNSFNTTNLDNSIDNTFAKTNFNDSDFKTSNDSNINMSNFDPYKNTGIDKSVYYDNSLASFMNKMFKGKKDIPDQTAESESDTNEHKRLLKVKTDFLLGHHDELERELKQKKPSHNYTYEELNKKKKPELLEIATLRNISHYKNNNKMKVKGELILDLLK
jgi:hypothetical protein